MRDDGMPVQVAEHDRTNLALPTGGFILIDEATNATVGAGMIRDQGTRLPA
jgi:sulfate adenylyltransferase subunit 1 (EFTu-like GTPase family)